MDGGRTEGGVWYGRDAYDEWNGIDEEVRKRESSPFFSSGFGPALGKAAPSFLGLRLFYFQFVGCSVPEKRKKKGIKRMMTEK
mmetsp:Transcript_2932/g.6012  ORF Transcript_2932/g.6012 Transcript_2932/m.6012 type:complete len:83 (+) Transcript_2932:90-338(+)